MGGLKGRLTLDLVHLCLFRFKVEVEPCSCCEEDSCTSEVEELVFIETRESAMREEGKRAIEEWARRKGGEER